MRYAIAISVIVHVALIVWSLKQPSPRAVTHGSRPAAVIPPAPPITSPEAAPMVVALLEDDTVATSTSGSTIASHGRTHRVAATSTTHTEIGQPSAASEHSSLMSMRHPGDDVPTIANGSTGGIIAALGGSPQWGHPPSAAEIDAGRESRVAEYDARASAELKPDGTGMKAEHKTFNLKVAADGTVKITDKPNWQQKGLFFAEFDVNDALMRRHGTDPYSSYKLKVLDETREQRYEMGKQFKTQQLAQSGRYMQKNIERLVASVQDPVLLKRGLFDLWDDCAESGSEELVAGGSSARDQLLGFVRRRFPQESPDAFSADELASLNKHRSSHAAFEPYL